MPSKDRAHIVVADDDDVNLEILIKCLEDEGYRIQGFPEGDVTWEYIESHADQIDLVLLDRMMHTLDGVEIAKRMKKHPQLSQIPIILQSGEANPDKIETAMLEGIDHYFTKPFSPNLLVKMIAEILARPR